MSKQAATVALVNAVLALAIAFGVDVSEAAQAAIVTAVNAVFIAVWAWLDPSVPYIGRTTERDDT